MKFETKLFLADTVQENIKPMQICVSITTLLCNLSRVLLMEEGRSIWCILFRIANSTLWILILLCQLLHWASPLSTTADYAALIYSK